MRIVLIAFLAMATAAAGAPAAQAERLTVVIDNLRSAKGIVRLAVWSRAEGFTDTDQALIRADLPARAREVRFDLGELPPGRYAIASYHDENGDGEFDRTWIGLPDEGLGFSNGAWIGLSAPSFREAAFELKPAPQVSDPQVVVVGLRYPGNKISEHPARRSP